MKKLMAIILALALAIAFTACGGQAAPEGGQPQQDQQVQQEEQQEPEKVVKNPAYSELYDEYGTKLADITYEYDQDGRRISNTTTWLEEWGGGYETDTYTYDADGNVAVKSNRYGDSDYVFEIYYEYENGKMVKESWGSDYWREYIYDDNGFLVKYVLHNGDSSEDGILYTCDSNGNVIEEKQVWDDEFTTTNTYTYDADGNMLNMDYAVNGEVLFSHVYEYDSDGLLTKQGVSIESWKLEGYVLHYYG